MEAVNVVHGVSPHSAVKLRESGVSSTLRLHGSITDVSGILDHPLEPVIRPARGRTGWRVMTTGVA
jgi:hypothetical protein